MSDNGQNGATSNSITGGAFHTVVQARDVTLQFPAPATEGGCTTPLEDPPPPRPEPVPEWVVDRDEGRQAVAAVCGSGASSVGITTSLWGAGGFGKTTLARMVCAAPEVQEHFGGRVYVITVGREVRGRAAIAAKVAEATRFITGDTTEFSDPKLAGDHLGRLLDERPRTLLVLDDVWERDQLEPFLRGGSSCVRLVTTRVPNALPHDAHTIKVDEMTPEQARVVLTWKLPSLPADVVEGLLRATGRWPLLLRLANGLISELVTTGADAAAAASELLRRLRTQGPAAVDTPDEEWDLDDPARRSRAVRATVEASTSLLPGDHARRFLELGVFVEDEVVPSRLVAQLWRATGGMDEIATRRLCHHLAGLSLLSLSEDNGGGISLHDAIRDYLRVGLGETTLATLHAQLIDVVADTLPVADPLVPGAPRPGRAWWRLEEGYLLDHLIEHLLAAGREDQAAQVAGDLRWVERRLLQRGPTAPISDLSRIPRDGIDEMRRPLVQAAHLLAPTEPERALISVLHSRLQFHSHWRDQVTARQSDPSLRPFLANRWPPPDLPHPALLRIVTGHTGWVRTVAIAPDGAWLTTAGDDKTVRLWNPDTGECTAILTGHTDWVASVAIAPDGTWLVSAGLDHTVRLWDRETGECTAILTGHTDGVNSVAVAPDGTWLATVSDDATVRIWDLATQHVATLLRVNGPVLACAWAPDTRTLSVSGSRGVYLFELHP